VTKYNRFVRDLVNEVSDIRAQHSLRPMLLCVSGNYRGPKFELELERKGARVVHVR
jgi:hypothetical protein